MYRNDGSLSIIGVWIYGGIIEIVCTMLWALTAGPLSTILDTFLGLSDVTAYSFMLANTIRTAFGYLLIVVDAGVLIWMITSAFKHETQERQL